jgi:hypothetical protein
MAELRRKRNALQSWYSLDIPSDVAAIANEAIGIAMPSVLFPTADLRPTSELRPRSGPLDA